MNVIKSMAQNEESKINLEKANQLKQEFHEKFRKEFPKGFLLVITAGNKKEFITALNECYRHVMAILVAEDETPSNN